MSRRTLATLVAAGLVLVLGVTVAAVSVPYVRQSPGPTVDVLGTRKGEPVVEVDGERTFPTDGSLRLTTVLVTQPQRAFNVARAPSAAGWTRTTAVLPYEALYPERHHRRGRAGGVGGADGQQPGHRGRGGADQDRLRPHDVRRGHRGHAGQPVGGRARAARPHPVPRRARRSPDVQQVFRAAGRAEPGDTLTGEVRRAGRTRPFEVTTEPAPDDPDRAMLGILVGTGYVFPFDVSIGISDSIGGPSAGLIFSLAVYDTLTEGSLTGGKDVAGTGTIAADGSVGPDRRHPAEDLRRRGDGRRPVPRAAGQLRRGAGDRPRRPRHPARAR